MVENGVLKINGKLPWIVSFIIVATGWGYSLGVQARHLQELEARSTALQINKIDRTIVELELKHLTEAVKTTNTKLDALLGLRGIEAQK